uniref:Uncharacterized protein n=1 Tax=Eptatretus burgeri TaxID=7764 RepID=A0A8C4QM12_EPTBU
MVLYLAFPVGIFWVSNQADYFEKHVVQRKVCLYPRFIYLALFFMKCLELLIIPGYSYFMKHHNYHLLSLNPNS